MPLSAGADDDSSIFEQGSAAVSNLVDQHFPGLAPSAGGSSGGGGGLSSGRWASAAGGRGGGQPPGSVFDFPSLSESRITSSLRYSLLSTTVYFAVCFLFCGRACLRQSRWASNHHAHRSLLAAHRCSLRAPSQDKDFARRRRCRGKSGRPGVVTGTSWAVAAPHFTYYSGADGAESVRD